MRVAPINEEWLRDSGFKWHQVDRQPGKHWLLWIGNVMGCFSSFEDLGIEIAECQNKQREWFCWLRSDTAGRYHRFIHLRKVTTCSEIIGIVEALTLLPWNPDNHIYGSLFDAEHAAHIRRDNQRLDHIIRQERPKWSETEKDDSRGRALPEHLEAHAKQHDAP